MHDRDAPTTQPLAQADGWLLGGRYRVLDRLGAGGMAEVFRAHDELLDRDVAVKVFRTAVDDADTQGELRRELELQSLARLSHPNLITLFDGSLSGDGPGYLVLELVDGPDLATRLRAGALSEPEVRQLGVQLADALAYIHAKGLVHRDVKPANILLGDDGVPGALRARLSDFGIVRMVGAARMTAADLTLGTASYVAPEQARGANVGPEADVYSLALVLLEALTGVRCFDGPLHEALAARLSSAPQIPADLPEPWPALLAAMTAADPAARPSAASVADSLRTGAAPVAVPGVVPGGADVSPAATTMAVPAAAATGSTQAIGPLPPGPPVGTRSRRRGRLLPLALLVLAAVVAGAGYLLLEGSGSTPKAPPQTPTVQRHSTAPVRHSTSASQVVNAPVTHRASHSRTPTPPPTRTAVHQKRKPPGKTKHQAAASAPLTTSITSSVVASSGSVATPGNAPASG